MRHIHLGILYKAYHCSDSALCKQTYSKTEIRGGDLEVSALGKDNSLKLEVFRDSSMGNLPDGGQLVMLMGENGRLSPICRQSKRIRRAVRSTLATEILALADGIDSAELTRGDCTRNNLPIVCVTDNHSLLVALKSTKVTVTKKKLDNQQCQGAHPLWNHPADYVVSYQGAAC